MSIRTPLSRLPGRDGHERPGHESQEITQKCYGTTGQDENPRTMSATKDIHLHEIGIIVSIGVLHAYPIARCPVGRITCRNINKTIEKWNLYAHEASVNACRE